MIKNNKGFTILETLAAAVVGILVAYATFSYLTFSAKLTNQLKLSRVSNDVVQSIVESIRFNLSLYQVSFETSLDKEDELLKQEKLPYGISNGNLVARDQCGKTVPCQAYFGYIIVPSIFIRNLYQVNLRVSLPGREEASKKYTYFITVK
ncbi:MAG: type II secretion system protein [Bdellovibrio sp.]|nr:type II secretion system protein [Bdellovibrio sp.]